MANRIVPGAGDVRRLNPLRPASVVRQASSNPAPTVILLIAALAAIQTFKAGQLPSAQSIGALAVAAIGFVLVANFAPTFVTYTLFLVLLWAALTNQPLIENAISRVSGAIQF